MLHIFTCLHKYTHVRLDKDQAVNTAIGAIVGALMGGANQYLRDKQLVASSPYVTFNVDPYDDEI